MSATLNVYVHVPATARTSAINAAAFSIDVTLPDSTLALLFPDAQQRRDWLIKVLTAIRSNTSDDDAGELRLALEHWLGR